MEDRVILDMALVDRALVDKALPLLDRTLVDKASVDTAMVCYSVLEPEIEEYSTSNDGSVSDRSFEKDNQDHSLSSQQSSYDSINPSSPDAPIPFSQQSNSSQDHEPSRISQELLAYKKRLEDWEEEMKEMIEEEKREFEEEIERKDSEYQTLGFDTREEEMQFRKDREKARRKSLL